MDMIDRIRRLHSRGEESEREIVRMTELSRKTAAKWLHEEVEVPPNYPCRLRHNKLTPFVESLKQALMADVRQNTGTWPRNGSWVSELCASVARPSKPLRISVRPAASHTRMPACSPIIEAPPGSGRCWATPEGRGRCVALTRFLQDAALPSDTYPRKLAVIRSWLRARS